MPKNKQSTQNLSLSFKLAYSGIICAISIIIMFISIVPGFTYALPALSGIFIWTVGEQVNKKWGILAYAASSALSLILIPEPEAVAFFISFFGYYPLIRDIIGRIKSRLLRLLSKLAVFNVTVVLTFQIVSRIVGLDRMLEGMEFMGEFAVYGLWALANVAFVCYDFCLEQLFFAYGKWLKPKLMKRIK